MNSQQKEKAKYEFNNNPEIKILIGNIAAVGIGLNLNKACNHCIFQNMDFTDADFQQACDRIYRIGSKEDVRFKVASLIHDIFCENKHYVDYDRYFADKVFERLLSVADTCAFNRWLIFHSVDNYQKFCGWRNKEK